MHLVRLVYASHLAEGCGPAELGKILDVSRKNNRDIGVTGALCYSEMGFLQCLEGPAAPVNELYRRIARDDRHVDVTLLDYTSIDHRDFGRWSMAYVRDDEIDGQILLQIRGSDTFDPFNLAPGEAVDFLKAMTGQRVEFLERQQSEAEG